MTEAIFSCLQAVCKCRGRPKRDRLSLPWVRLLASPWSKISRGLEVPQRAPSLPFQVRYGVPGSCSLTLTQPPITAAIALALFLVLAASFLTFGLLSIAVHLHFSSSSPLLFPRFHRGLPQLDAAWVHWVPPRSCLQCKVRRRIYYYLLCTSYVRSTRRPRQQIVLRTSIELQPASYYLLVVATCSI